MKNLFSTPSWLIPINIFHVRGICCCLAMHDNFLHQNFTNNYFCYVTQNIYHANTIIIWGNLSPKLHNLFKNYHTYLPRKNCLIHINSCTNMTNMPEIIKPDADINITCQDLDKARIRYALKEARQCLKA